MAAREPAAGLGLGVGPGVPRSGVAGSLSMVFWCVCARARLINVRACVRLWQGRIINLNGKIGAVDKIFCIVAH